GLGTRVAWRYSESLVECAPWPVSRVAVCRVGGEERSAAERAALAVIRPHLLKHSRADLHADRNHVIHRQARALRMLAAGIRPGGLELTKRMLAICGEMAADPFHSGNLGTYGFHAAAYRGQLFL